MIEFIPNYIEYSDKRGSFLGLINFGNWKEINIICSEADTVRGDHYHENTDELFLILEGKIKITLQKVLDNEKLDNEKKTFEIQEIALKRKLLGKILKQISWNCFKIEGK